MTSLARLLVRLFAWLVPSDARTDWRQEWLAEIEARRSGAGGPTALGFARGAPLHAWALRRAGWHPASIGADVRFALRWLARRPVFAVTSILTLAMGIGAATGILSIAYGVLWKPLPYREPDRLVQLYETNPLFGWTEATIAPGNLISWQERNQSFQAIASYVGSASRQSMLTDVTLTGDAPVRLRALRVSANFFDVLGVRPRFGRGFVAGEDLPGQHRKLVLGHGFWQRQFGGDPGAVGQSLTLNGNAFEIVGVLPEHFEFDRTDTDVFAPLAANPADQRDVRRPHYLRGIARLAPGVTIDAARADLTSIAGALEREYPDTNRQMGAGIRPLDDWFVGESRRPLLVFLAGVVLLLLMACANVAGLLVARASERRGEFGVRAALGASRARMVRQLLVEAAVISSVGAALGLALGHAAVRIFLNVAPPGLPRIDQIGLQPVVLLAAAGLAVVATVLVGLAPALQASRSSLRAGVGSGSRSTAPAGTSFRLALVGGQVTLALVLLVATFLAARSFSALVTIDPGFDPAGLTTARVALPGASYRTGDSQSAFFESLAERLRARPSITSAGATARLPLDGALWSGDLFVEGKPDVQGRELRHKSITTGYLETLGVRLVRGRAIDDTDVATGLPVVVANEALVRTYFDGEDPVGRRIAFDRPSDGVRWRTIVGVAADEPQDGLGTPVAPEVYEAQRQQPFDTMDVLVRSGLPLADAVTEIRTAVRALDPALAVYDEAPLSDRLSRAVARSRTAAWLATALGASALLLAVVGIYGVAATAVAARTREIGVRVAFGATRMDVIRALLRREAMVVSAGLLAGTVVAVLLGRAVASLLFGIAPFDPVSYSAAGLAIVISSAVALIVPARRALRLDAAAALRQE